MYDLVKVKEEFLKHCKALLPESDYEEIGSLGFESYEPNSRTLVLRANNAGGAIRSTNHSHNMIAILEGIVGEPAYVEVHYRSRCRRTHKRFTTLCEECEDPKGELHIAPSSLSRNSASTLEERIASLEKKIEALSL